MVENQKVKSKVLLIKTPTPNYLLDQYRLKLVQLGYSTYFLPVIGTRVYDSEGLDQLIRLGPRGRWSAVVLTSLRSVESIQLVLDRSSEDGNVVVDDQPMFKESLDRLESVRRDWESIPFFVVGQSTAKGLRNLRVGRNSYLPSTDRLTILGQDDTGNGSRLANFIINHFHQSEEDDGRSTGARKLLKPGIPSGSLVRAGGGDQQNVKVSGVYEVVESVMRSEGVDELLPLLHLVGDKTHPGLSDQLLSPTTSESQRFSIVEHQVYETLPIREPRIITPEQTAEMEEECFRLTEDDWLVLFSPSSARLGLNHLIKTRSLCKTNGKSEVDDDGSEGGLVDDDRIIRSKVAVIGPTTNDFLNKNFNGKFKPHVISTKPDPCHLISGIFNFDNQNKK
ncbi:expressed protein [Phakopsora pachyrhizi]|uniref:Expressed protein n=1 Tax=Phakopsora pachyrhizi TaxID=170000 RepID=A0AAV0B432_PHAPC|nr:expressed protein [Phakopsora pachyrhizi]